METQINEYQVDDGKMNYHIIKILPINANILKKGKYLNTELNTFIFKVDDHLYFK